MQCPPAVAKLLSNSPCSTMCRSLIAAYRPQELEIGTVLGLSPLDAKPGYAPQWAQHSASVKRSQRHQSEMLRVGLLARSAWDGAQAI